MSPQHCGSWQEAEPPHSPCCQLCLSNHTACSFPDSVPAQLKSPTLLPSLYSTATSDLKLHLIQHLYQCSQVRQPHLPTLSHCHSTEPRTAHIQVPTVTPKPTLYTYALPKLVPTCTLQVRLSTPPPSHCRLNCPVDPESTTQPASSTYSHSWGPVKDLLTPYRTLPPQPLTPCFPNLAP